nr:unnamed protein product [Digitaria exilis]
MEPCEARREGVHEEEVTVHRVHESEDLLVIVVASRWSLLPHRAVDLSRVLRCKGGSQEPRLLRRRSHAVSAGSHKAPPHQNLNPPRSSPGRSQLTGFVGISGSAMESEL